MSSAPSHRLASAYVDLDQFSEQSLDPVDLFRVLYRAATGLLDTTGFYLGLYDAGSGIVEIVRQMESGTELPGGAFPLGHGLTSQAILTRQAYLARRWSERGLQVQLQYATSRSDLPESVITVPIVGPASDEVLGVVAVQSYQPDAYDESDVPALERLASAAARVIDRRLTAHEPRHDRLRQVGAAMPSRRLR